MENYNEKQIKLNREVTEMREKAFNTFNNRRQELCRLKEEIGHVFEQEKKRLATQLDDVLKERNTMRADGYSNTHKAWIENCENERRIHTLQAENRMAFFDKARDINRRQNDNLEDYRAEKIKIADYKAERLLEIEREHQQEKLLSLSSEKEKD